MLNARVAAGVPFGATGTVAIIAGGVVAAVVAYHPTQHLVWMVAYLVLVVGVMQWVFGIGQAWLAAAAPTRGVAWGQWGLFNLGSVAVIGGTFDDSTRTVTVGTVLFALAIGWFLYGVRHGRHRGWCRAYQVLLALILVSACIGLVISAVSNAAA